VLQDEALAGVTQQAGAATASVPATTTRSPRLAKDAVIVVEDLAGKGQANLKSYARTTPQLLIVSSDVLSSHYMLRRHAEGTSQIHGSIV
jgi:hypothetical protein